MIPILAPRTCRISRTPNCNRFLPLEQHLTIHDPPRRIRYQPHNRQRRNTLTASRLADQPDRLALIDVQVDTINRPHNPEIGMKLSLEVPDLQQMAI